MVVDEKYVTTQPLDLAVVGKSPATADGNFSVLDINGNLVFKIKEIRFSLHDRQVLLDASNHPVLSFKKKHLTMHGRWQAFKGESSSSKDLLFSVKWSSALQPTSDLNVFLAENKEEIIANYTVVGDWKNKSCTIYAHDAMTVIAQMHKKHNITGIELGKGTFGVTVNPNVDYAFVIALIMILDEMYDYRGRNDGGKKKKKSKGKKDYDDSNHGKKEDVKKEKEKEKEEGEEEEDEEEEDEEEEESGDSESDEDEDEDEE